MTPEELASELGGGRVRPAYLLLGEEPLLQEQALAAIRAAVLEGAPPEFNLDRLEASDTTPGRLQEALQVLPVLGSRRLVWLRDLGVGRDAPRPLVEALPELLHEAASGVSVLVVTSRAEPRRATWARSFRDPAAIVACDPPRGRRALLAFVRDEAKRQGLTLEAGAAERLAEQIGPQLLMLRNEIAKVALLAGGKGRVRAALVAEGASDVADEPIWELTDAIGEGHAGEALESLGRMLSSGVPPPLLLGSLASHFRKLIRVRSGSPPPGPRFVVDKLGGQAHRYAPERLLTCLAAIHETDEFLKGRGGLDPRLALERLVLGLAA